jgi:extracellular factor (EF) 3-hydroxypalmitic acid methyl ester biosynthesis protein
MVFGVPWNKQADAASPQRSMDELMVTARIAAEQLVRDLERARQLTREWADEKLTDVLVDTAISTSLHQLARTGCWGEANRVASGEFWRIAGPLLAVGRLQRHARLKPRGYAGDYQMLDWICSGDCCDHPLGRAFDRYFQCQAAPQAVRSRTIQTAAALVTHCLQTDAARLHVVSLGAGPAIDIGQALSLLSEERRARLRVTLLDLDPEALDSAHRRLKPLLPSDAVECIRENLFRLPQRRHPEKILGSPSFLVCSGLFDYLGDVTATDMLRLLWQRLGEGGQLLVGNFMPHNPTRAYMEWIGNWYLIYRTADELERLGVQAGIPGDLFSISTERLGVDLFLIARKPPG